MWKKEKARRRKEDRLLAESLGIKPDYGRKKLHINEASSFVRSFIIFVIATMFVVLFKLLFGIVKVDGKSMNPTLHHNEIMLIKKERVERFDVVVLDERLHDNGENKKIVKRVIGLGGDRITVIDGVLYINDTKVDENYLDSNNIKQFKRNNFETYVPDGYIFVLGDNRDNSKDSRHVGNFKESAVVGVRIW